jgi:hypothetical protein
MQVVPLVEEVLGMIDLNPLQKPIRDFQDQEQHQCNHGVTSVTKKVCSNGVVQYRIQCMICGDTVSGIKKSEAMSLFVRETGLDHCMIPDFDHELRNRYWREREALRRSEWEERKRLEKEEWDAWYSQYLASAKWREKRDAVMFRTRGVCEGCRNAKADIVHHLTYDNVGDELLYELVALCNRCHDKAHGRA